jgi:hypothetical protein
VGVLALADVSLGCQPKYYIGPRTELPGLVDWGKKLRCWQKSPSGLQCGYPLLAVNYYGGRL